MKRILALVTVVFLMTASLPLSAGADAGLSFASIFGDGMVLQQGRPVQVFGFGRDGDTVTVTLKKGDEAVASQTAAVSGGRWNAALPAQSGSFDEYSLEAKAGSVVRTVENLVFGEVWIAGGQSNMEWTLAKAAEAGGADVLSLINTITGMKIDIHKRAFAVANKTGGLSGPAIKPVAVRMVYQVANAVKLPIIGMGGIMCADDAIEFMMAGATAVSVGTANFHNPYATQEIVEGMEAYMKKYQVEDINSLIGIVK